MAVFDPFSDHDGPSFEFRVEASRSRSRRRERRLEVISSGAGESVLLVHGSLADGPSSWAHQQPLGERWRLRVVQRRGFGNSPASEGEDFERDADDLCDLLSEPAHVVAHGYGAIGALLAAPRRPRAARSLTLIEPTLVSATMEDPKIAGAAGAIADWWMQAPHETADFLAGYSALLGVRVPELGGGKRGLQEAARYLRNCRPPWTADVPWDEFAHARIPTLVVSGGHAPAVDAVAAAIAANVDGRHKIIHGSGHAVQRAAAFNPALERHLRAAAGG
jgi:pimeloyl-ACP methyl ester carboxylesterase